MSQRLHVKYDAARLTTGALVDAVGQTGMRMWLEHDEPRSGGSSDLRARLLLMLATAGGIAAGLASGAAGLPGVTAALFVAATLLGAIFPARRAIAALRTGTIDINVLMMIAVAGALILGERLEAASVVGLFAVAQWLEVRTLERARHAIRSLLDLSPRSARVMRDGVEQSVPVDDIRAHEVVLVRPGEKVAIDGTVIAGTSEVNEASLTGESLPVMKAAGDEVFAGTINGRGSLDLRVTRVGRDTRLARIIHLVEQAQAQRAPVQSFVDRFARIYTPVVIAIALAVAVVPPLLLDGAVASDWVYRGLTLLVIACPCALVISTPVSFVAALSAAARSGVLIKGGGHLERLAAVRIIAFDKTGTLTAGEPAVSSVQPAGSASATDVLRLAAAVETRSEHPIGRAIVDYARRHGVDVPDAAAFSSRPGLGAEARVLSRLIVVGNARLLASHDVAAAPMIAAGDRPGASIFVAADGVLLGAIHLEDRLRETARETIELLREQGIERVVMLTGDEARVAQRIADAVGVDDVRAGLLPEDKHRIVQEVRREGALMMVGDGVNDAPALAAADVGVAMGAAGSDAAIEAADVALMSDELLKLPFALRLARATMRNVKTNVAVSLILKAAFLVLAAAGLATLWMAVLADTGASVIVVANALRLLRQR
jgi:Cd2+/Zn2+-exporting ATPase